MARDRANNRLGEQHATGAHGAIAVRCHAVHVAAACHCLEVGPRTEGAVLAVEHGHIRIGVGIKFTEGIRQGLGRWTIHGIASMRPIDGYQGNAPTALDANRHKGSPLKICGKPSSFS